MIEMVLQSKTLPEPILRLIHTDKVMVRAFNGEVRLMPIEDSTKLILPILGMYNDGKLTVDGYLTRKYADQELER